MAENGTKRMRIEEEYVDSGEKRGSVPNYDSRFTMVFPRIRWWPRTTRPNLSSCSVSDTSCVHWRVLWNRQHEVKAGPGLACVEFELGRWDLSNVWFLGERPNKRVGGSFRVSRHSIHKSGIGSHDLSRNWARPQLLTGVEFFEDRKKILFNVLKMEVFLIQ